MLRPDLITTLPQTSVLLTCDDRLLGPIWEENRIAVPLTQVAPYITTALIATEDRRFYSHGGIDFKGMLRAAYKNARRRRLVEGGSTLTQQLARMAVLRRADRTIARKLVEAYIAIRLEQCYQKTQILEAYLNAAYFGHNIYGIELAALTYFRKRAADLNELEAAHLVGMLKAPARYCCCCNPSRSTDRSKTVLRLSGFRADPIEGFQHKRRLQPRRRYCDRLPLTGGYVREFVRVTLTKNLPDYYPSRRMVVQTTIDPVCQCAIEEACGEVQRAGYSGRLACLIQDARTGAIRGMSGGVDFRKSQFNSATNGLLQPGSLLKPFILLEAVRKGISPDYALVSNPLTLNIGAESWIVRNAGANYHGRISIAEALVHSDNTVYAQLLLQIGVEEVVRLLKHLAVPIKRGTPALSTGAIRPGVSPLQMCSAYSVFSNYGVFAASSIIRRVADENGESLLIANPTLSPVCSHAEASLVNNVLKRASEEGTAVLPVAQEGLAAKTGTSISGGWYVGFDDVHRLLTWTEHDFLPIGISRYSDKAVSAKGLASRIWGLLARPKLGFSELYSSFAGVDALSVHDLLWIEEEFQTQ
jgi:penicillin-binding protein 1A